MTVSTGSPPSAHARESHAEIRSLWPRFEDDEIAAVEQVLRSGRVNCLVHGQENDAFEREFAAFLDMPRGLCVANGTVSLELALRAFGIGPGDEVIVPARSFVATATCIIAVGASAVFADVLPGSQNIDPASVERLISSRTRAIICVHLAGWPCQMEALQQIARDKNLYLIEDCAQAHGAEINGRKVGSFGDASSFSFCTDKIMSSGGEGGIVLFKTSEHWARAWSYKDHGKDYSGYRSGKGSPGEFRYVHVRPGTNYRLTEMQAAIARQQLRKLPGWLGQRRTNAACLTAALQGHPDLMLPVPPPGVQHAWYKYYVQLRDEGRGTAERRAKVLQYLQAEGIPCGSGTCPDMSLETAFAGYNPIRDGQLEEARALGERTIMFPVDHTLKVSDMERIAETLLRALAQ